MHLVQRVCAPRLAHRHPTLRKFERIKAPLQSRDGLNRSWICGFAPMTSFARNTGGASFVDLLKDGSKHFSGVDEAISRNIEACMKLSTIVRTSLGPNGMNKMVVNHLDKIFVTSDSSTILREMEVQHPAAKLVYLAGQMQQQEVGDHSNWVTIFAGELLHKAQQLLQMGIHQADIIAGYTRASKVAREALQKLAVASVSNLRDHTEVSRALSSVIASKMHGLETIITPLVAQACVQTLPKDIKKFSVDNVRVAQVLGGALQDSSVISGFVVTRNSEGVVKLVENAKVAVFSVGIELATTETKGTVLLKNASELMNYAKTEEDAMQKMIDEIADTGVNVVVAGGPIHELALHFLERRKLMLVKVVSKFDLRRLCRFLGATALSRVGAPTKEEIGSCDRCEVREIGGTVCTVLDNSEGHSSRVATILVRTSTNNLADDVHRSIDSGVSVFKMLTKDNRLCAGAGAVEIELARAVAAVADTTLGLDQYGIRKFAESFEVVARTLAENAAQDGNEVVSALYSEHQKGNVFAGVDVTKDSERCATIDAVQAGILDHVYSKTEALRLAVDAAVTVLRVDQIIMAKQAGGPKAPAMGGGD